MNYDESVEFIKEAEARESADRSLSVDVYDLGPAIDVRQYSDSQTAQIIAFVDTAENPQRQKAEKETVEQRSRGRARGPAGATLITEKLETSTSELGRVAKTSGERIGRELSSLLAATENELSKYTNKTSDNRLIMIHLSLQDQINELEKIDLNLELNAFDREQLGIVRAEIKGLMKNKGKEPTDSFQKNLYELRNRRLEQVAKRL